MLIQRLSIPWHCGMGGQSKSIKSLNSGQGLRDPSPWGDPDNHQILLFKRWHVYKLFKPLSLFGHSEHMGLCLLHRVDLLPFSARVSTGLLPCLFFYKSWTGCGATLWYSPSLTVYVFMSCQAWEISIKSSSENMRNLAQVHSKLPPHWITNAVTGSNSQISVSRKQTF